MKNAKFKILVGGAIVVIIGLAGWYLNKPEKVSAAMTQFAQCLRDKQITMYGAYWCSHCQNEKKAFGDSFKSVPYVECPDDPQKCLTAGINGYPTWIFPDGKKLEVEQGLEKQSQQSGCALPNQ